MPADVVDLFGTANTRSARRAENQRTRSGALNWCDVFIRQRVRRQFIPLDPGVDPSDPATLL
jgi:hypothetical protein